MSIPHRVVGHGPHTVFLLHGWFGSAQGWGSFPDYLNPELATWVFTDSRGYGARMNEAGVFTLDEVAGGSATPRAVPACCASSPRPRSGYARSSV